MRLGILGAAAWDWLVGEPAPEYHPVVWMGQQVSALEEHLYADDTLRGALLAAAVVPTWAVAGALMGRTVGTGTAVAARSLAVHARSVAWALKLSLEEGREAVGMMVGRDVTHLDEAGVIRACVESVAEGACDGVIAPLFYGALGGGAGAMAYRAVNTLDSMVGHNDGRYAHFGTASAKLDDALNLVPARLTGMLLCASAPMVGLDGENAWRTYHRDRHQHPSPNSAHGMAAMAGALGIRLCGPAHYDGEAMDKPWLGDALTQPTVEHIHQSVELMLRAHLLAVGLFTVLAP